MEHEIKDGHTTLIDASIISMDTTVYAEFRDEDKRWYMKINDDMIALEDVIESLKIVNEKLLEFIPVTTDDTYDVFADLGLSEKDTEQDDEVLEIIGRIS